MKKGFAIGLIGMSFLMVSGLYAQDSTRARRDTLNLETKAYQPFVATLQLRSMYIWRGFRVSNSPISDADIHYISRDGHFKAGFWGGAGFNGEYREFDYYLNYANGGFNAYVWDINNFTSYPNADIFNYKRASTSHFIDAGVGYQFHLKLPLTINWNTIIEGRDFYTKNDNNTANRYSNYVQVDQVLWQDGFSNLHLFVGGGFAFGRKDNFYGSKPNVVNTGFTYNKDLVVFKYHIPMSATAMLNPEQKYGALQLVANIF